MFKIFVSRSIAAALAIAAAAVVFAAPAKAQTSTIFLTDRAGQIPFPFLPPNRATGGPGSINNMTIGATTPAPGHFTTLDSTSAPSGAGITALFASPPAIGGTAPAAGSFTALNFSGQITPTGAVPTIASGDCGTTTNGAVVAGSTNASGSITIGAATTTTCKITFAAGLTAAPKACVFFPMNATAAATGTTVARVGAPTLTDVTLTGSALASANYAFHCM